MGEDRGDLLIFIDLAFVLLVGFLILTETTPRLNVALPGDPEAESTEVGNGPKIYNLYFDGSSQFIVEDSQSTICNVMGYNSLIECMRELASTVQTAVFVIIPQGRRATVQVMVSILDLCYHDGLTCTVSN